jgi:murein DD-endopeptidase MepM/ murein hydrolase activator NlpD
MIEMSRAAGEPDRLEPGAGRRAAPLRSLAIVVGGGAILALMQPSPGNVAPSPGVFAAAAASRGVEEPRRAAPMPVRPLYRPALLELVAERSRSGWSEVEHLLESVGVDIDNLLSRYGAIPPAQGGPFVALDGLKARPKSGTDEVVAGLPMANLQKALRSLPLTAPLAQYHLESGFGVRSDPFNHRRSIHTGLDFSAPFRSPVYNTGPGVVIYAGPKGEYGKVVEVDHGGGIVTRYAHLHRTMVVRGQRLGEREQIGQLGSTGRSSGPHVHYEVLVNGVPQDPEKFLAIGRSVLAAAAH